MIFWRFPTVSPSPNLNLAFEGEGTRNNEFFLPTYLPTYLRTRAVDLDISMQINLFFRFLSEVK